MHQLQQLPDRTARGIAAAALTVSCVLGGPVPAVVEALERLYAVAVVERDERRRHPVDTSRRGLGTRHPKGRRPQPARP